MEPTATPAPPLTAVVPDEPVAALSVKLGYAPGEDFVAIEKTRTALAASPGTYVTLTLEGDYLARPVRRATRELTEQIKNREEHFLFVPKALMDAKGLTLGQVVPARRSSDEERPARHVPQTRAQVLASARTLADRFRADPATERLIVGIGFENNRDVLFVYTNGIAEAVWRPVVPPDWQGLSVILREVGSVTPAPTLAEMNPPAPPAPQPRQPEDEGDEAGQFIGRRDPHLAPFADLPLPSRLDSLPTVRDVHGEIVDRLNEHVRTESGQPIQGVRVVSDRETFEFGPNVVVTNDPERPVSTEEARAHVAAGGSLVRTARGQEHHGPFGWLGSAMGLPGHTPLPVRTRPAPRSSGPTLIGSSGGQPVFANHRTPDAPVDFHQLVGQSAATMQALGMQYYQESGAAAGLHLFPANWYSLIPDGLPVVNIFGEQEIFQRGQTDNEARSGCLAYGLIACEEHPRDEEEI